MIRASANSWILLCLLVASVAGADIIHYKQGRVRENVIVVSENSREVVYKDSSSAPEARTPAHLVARVEYEDAPYDFRDGCNALQQKNYEDAVYFLERTLGETSGVRGWIRIHAPFYLARAYHESAESKGRDDRYRKAFELYQKVLATDPSTFFVKDCHFYSARCLLRMGEFARARESLNHLQGILQGKEDEGWNFSATLLQGHVAMEQKNYAEAVPLYRKAKSLVGDSRQDEAGLAIAACYLVQGEFAKALAEFQSTAQSKSRDIQAGAKNGMASCYLAQGDLGEARRMAIEVVCGYPSSAEHPHALFLLGECYEKAAGKEKNSRERARVCYELVRTGYPETAWGRRAARKLEQLGQSR